MKMEFTKLSSKGQIVIPQSIRKKFNLDKNMPLVVIENDDSIIIKKVDMPKIKSWKDVSKPFKTAAKKSSFGREDLAKKIKKRKNFL